MEPWDTLPPYDPDEGTILAKPIQHWYTVDAKDPRWYDAKAEPPAYLNRKELRAWKRANR